VHKPGKIKCTHGNRRTLNSCTEPFSPACTKPCTLPMLEQMRDLAEAWAQALARPLERTRRTRHTSDVYMEPPSPVCTRPCTLSMLGQMWDLAEALAQPLARALECTGCTQHTLDAYMEPPSPVYTKPCTLPMSGQMWDLAEALLQAAVSWAQMLALTPVLVSLLAATATLALVSAEAAASARLSMRVARIMAHCPRDRLPQCICDYASCLHGLTASSPQRPGGCSPHQEASCTEHRPRRTSTSSLVL